MTKSWNPRRGRKHYDRAGAVVLNTVKLGQAPVSLDRIRWLHRGVWIALALTVAVGGAAAWLTLDPRFYVYDAQIVGTRRVSAEDVFDASGLRGLHIFWARSAAIETSILEALPSLKRVDATCKLPAKCVISVVERRPRVLWDESGDRWWIDEQGAVFVAQQPGAEVAAEDEAGGRWKVTGPLPRDDDGDLDDEVRVALAELWESGRELPTTFQYDAERGLSFVDDHGWRVVVGQGTGMARRLRVLDGLVAYLEARGVQPSFVDVRFPEAPYYAPAEE